MTVQGAIPFMQISGLRKRFGSVEILKGIDLDLEKGGFLVLVGPSGCGKSTLLNTIAGLEPISEGSIRVEGQEINGLHPSKRDIAMVFQSYALYPNMTVAGNIAFGMEMRGVPKPERDKAIEQVAKTLQIGHLLDRKPSQLSGGQRQRVAMGRALVRDPKLFLFDEPLSNLDAKLRVDMRVEIKRLHAATGKTIIYVTHDQIEAMTMATHVGVLDAGRLVQFGTPRTIYEEPVSLTVASRLGQPRINTLPAALFGPPPANAAWIGLRPEHIHEGDGREASVARVEHLGDQTRLHLVIEGHPIVTLTDPHTPLRPGAIIRISPRNPLYFAADGARLV
jgi:multiple sugar transport system ATP-binding protein